VSMFTVRSLQQGLSTVIAVAEISRSKGGIFQEEHGRERAGAYYTCRTTIRSDDYNTRRALPRRSEYDINRIKRAIGRNDSPTDSCLIIL